MQTNRSNAGSLVAGAGLIAFGLLTLAGRLIPALNWSLLWPFFIIGLGALFFVAMLAGGKPMAGLAIPGSVVSGVGLILLFQNITGRWESMSYFWALIILCVGVGIYLMGSYGGDENQKRTGVGMMKAGFLLFLIFGAFFEMIFSSANEYTFPALLILLGAYLILSRSGVFTRKSMDKPSDGMIPPAS